MKRIIVPLTLFFISTIAFAQDVDLLWKARALQATENLEKLHEKMKEKDSRNIRFEIMLESAYAMISVMPDVTVKKTPTSVSYHLVMNYGDDGMLDVLYTYDLKSQECIGVHVDSLPKKRRLSLPVKSQFGNVFIISNPGDKTEPAVVFDRDNPFKSFVVDLK